MVTVKNNIRNNMFLYVDIYVYMYSGVGFERPISLWRTAYSTVTQARRNLPDAIGAGVYMYNVYMHITFDYQQMYINHIHNIVLYPNIHTLHVCIHFIHTFTPYTHIHIQWPGSPRTPPTIQPLYRFMPRPKKRPPR